MKKSVIMFLSVLLLFSYAYADLEPDEKSLKATKTTERIRIDGVLDEIAWLKGQTVSSFTQTDPDEGEPARYDTKVVMLYDDEALYFGFTCYDNEPGDIVRVLAARDSWTSSDKVQIEIDSYHDHITSYFFEVNASGVQRDAYRSSEHDYDMSWNCVWQAEASVGTYGWTAEYRIPFNCLIVYRF